MSTQFTDDSFSEIKPLDEAKKEFDEYLETIPEKVKAFHVGARDDLLNRQQNVDLEQRVDELAQKVEGMKDKSLQFPHVALPTQDDIQRIAREMIDERQD